MFPQFTYKTQLSQCRLCGRRLGFAQAMARADIVVVGAHKPGPAIYVDEQLLRELQHIRSVTPTRSKIA